MAFVILTVFSFAVQAKTPLVALIDNNCLQALPAEIVAQHKISHDIRFQAVHVDVDGDPLVRSQLWLSHPCVRAVSADAPVHSASLADTDPLDTQQAGLASIHHVAGIGFFYHPVWGIQAPVVAATVDTGIQPDHPDLSSRLWHGPSAEVGYSVLTGLLNPADDNGHGTHVSGILGAQRGNGIGIEGVMGNLIQLMSVKALDATGGGSISDVINGIQWAADHGAEVINLSLASLGANSALETSIQYALNKNVVVVAAAGNLAGEISSSNYIVPAAYGPDYGGLISVGAVDAVTDTLPSYSNYSSSYVEIGAPGSTGANGLLSTYINSSYIQDSGTSISAPHVAGAAALVISFLKTYGFAVSNSTVENWIEASANTSTGLNQDFVGGRFLDLERLGRYVFYSTVIDASGGFDDP